MNAQKVLHQQQIATVNKGMGDGQMTVQEYFLKGNPMSNTVSDYAGKR